MADDPERAASLARSAAADGTGRGSARLDRWRTSNEVTETVDGSDQRT